MRVWSALITVLRKLLVSQSGEAGNKSQSELENLSIRNKNQSALSFECQSVSEVVDSKSETLETVWSNKKKRKSAMENTTLMESCDSSICDNDRLDGLYSHIQKMNTLLQGSVDADAFRKDIDLVTCRISASENLGWDKDEAALNPSAMYSFHRSLMFKGQLERQRLKVIKMQVQSVMAALLVTFDLDQFKALLQGLVDDVVCFHFVILFSDIRDGTNLIVKLTTLCTLSLKCRITR